MTNHFDNFQGSVRYAEWIKTLEEITEISQPFEADIAILRKLAEWHRKHPDDKRLTSDMCGWISRLAARSIAIAIRSFTDLDKDTLSVRLLLLDIRSNKDLVDILQWPPGDISDNDEVLKNYEVAQRQKQYDEVWGKDRTEKIMSVQKLLNSIPDREDVVRRYATQEVAHNLRNPKEIDLNYEKLLSTGDSVLCVIRDLNMKLRWSQRNPMDIRMLRLFPD